MKKSIQLFRISTVICFTALLTIITFTSSVEAKAEAKKIYKEMEFIKTFNGKNKKFVLEALGEPSNKKTPVKPTDSSKFVGEAKPNNRKTEVIEMWYYPNLVSYNSKQTFKRTEITFIDDVVSNMTFVN